MFALVNSSNSFALNVTEKRQFDKILSPRQMWILCWTVQQSVTSEFYYWWIQKKTHSKAWWQLTNHILWKENSWKTHMLKRKLIYLCFKAALVSCHLKILKKGWCSSKFRQQYSIKNSWKKNFNIRQKNTTYVTNTHVTWLLLMSK